ncbi:MAG: hypothetical protein FWD64_09870 [Acidobacteriaceae bacterium]|nr:hypothetical protein [Acidobacteriaceae bacterium]
MAQAALNPKQEAHELIDQMSTGQVTAFIGLFRIVLDPVDRALANAPYDDEPVSAEEAREISETRAALARGEGIVSNEEVLAEFGLTAEDFERMGRTPLPNHPGL